MEELKAYKNWIVTYVQDKIPLNPYSGIRANVVDPYTWSDYTTAEACIATNKFLTLGFVLTNSPFTCIDLDTYKTKDQKIIDNHEQIYNTFNTYSELSPQAGVHIWCQGTVPEGKRLPQQFIEIYSSSRYMTVTKRALNSLPIQNRQNELNELYLRIVAAARKNPLVAMDDQPPIEINENICNRAASAANGELFTQLYQGNWQNLYSSHSEADQAFVDIVAFYTDSKTQVAEIFHQSQLGQRNKSLRKDYLFHPHYGIITRSFDRKKPNVTYANLEQIVKQECEKEQKRIINMPIEVQSENSNGFHGKLNKLPEFIREDYLKFDWELPPGMLGDVARFIYRNAVHPVKEVAIGAAIGFMAGLCGKANNISNTGLNHYVAILAQTGGGKEGAASGIERLSSYIREKNPQIDLFLGPAEIASPQALIKHLATESQCFVSHKGEMGFWLQGITSKYANSHEKGLRKIILDLYTKSGRTDVFRGTVYSDKTRNIPLIHAPSFTLLGDATPHTFYAAMDEENVEEGFVGRFTIIECDGEERTPYNEVHGTIVPDNYLIDTLSAMVRHNLAAQQNNDPVQIQQTSDAYTAQMRFQNECDEKMHENRDSAEAKIYSRAHLRLLRLMGLIAVGVNPSVPCVTPDMVDWARKFIVQGIAKVTWRFEHGEVGEASMYVQQQNAIKQIIRSYWDNHFQQGLIKDGITREMYDAKMITHHYLSRRIVQFAAFKKSRNPSLDLDNMMKEMQKSSIVQKIDMGLIRNSGKTGVAYYILNYDSLKRLH
jgi:hypothetical protein